MRNAIFRIFPGNHASVFPGIGKYNFPEETTKFKGVTELVKFIGEKEGY